VADRVADELAQHTKVMDDLIASMAGVHNGMTTHKALTQGMTSINTILAGAGASSVEPNGRSFEEAS